MVVYVTYRVPVEVGAGDRDRRDTDVHIMNEKLEEALGVFNYVLVPIGGRLKKQVLIWPLSCRMPKSVQLSTRVCEKSAGFDAATSGER